MPKALDLTDKRIGKLTVIKALPERKNGQIMWECVCDCGKTIAVRCSSLVRGSTQSCGCMLIKDLTGQRFGRLVVIKLAFRHPVKWLCQCDCGKEKAIRATSLMGGTISCGCYNKERVSETSVIDLTGRRFGKLVALEKTDTRRWKFVVWRCRCDCGNETELPSGVLISGNTKSCGCLKSGRKKKTEEIE